MSADLVADMGRQIVDLGQARRAHRLLGDGSAGTGEVKVTKVHEIAGEGTEIQGYFIPGGTII